MKTYEGLGFQWKFFLGKRIEIEHNISRNLERKILHVCLANAATPTQ